MSVYANVNGMKKISNIFANVGGVKKEIVSAWVNKDGVPTKIFGLNTAMSRYVAVGYDNTDTSTGYIHYSDNLTKWTRIVSSGFPSEKIAYGNGKYVIASHTGEIRTSVDGITWTDAITPVTGTQLHNLQFLNGIFIMIMRDENVSPVACYIYISTDGINWTKSTVSISGKYIWEIAYGNGKYVTVGTKGASYYSTDGINWTAGSGLDTSKSYKCVTYGNGVFVAGVEYSSSGYTYYSTDGITWKKGSKSINYTYGIAFGNGIFMLLSNKKYIYTSTDGITWTHIATLTANYDNLFFANDRFFVLKSGSIAHSIDGITWTQVTIVGNKSGIAYGGTDGQ